MIVMPMTALALMVQKFGVQTLLGGTACAMFFLGFILMFTSWRALSAKPNQIVQSDHNEFMIVEIVILVVLAGAFVVLKIFQTESERKRRLEREERKIRDKAATGGFSNKDWQPKK